MGCQPDLKKDYNKWIEISCFIEGASKREGSLGIGATSAWPGTWVDPPCWHHTAQPSARLAARGRPAHPPLKSLRLKERKIEECSSCWFAKMWFCKGTWIYEMVGGPTAGVDGGHFPLDIIGKCRVNYEWYVHPFSLSLGCPEGTEIKTASLRYT